jgi:hypothetical protein
MRPRLHNQVCAHPMAVSWVLGACALDAVILILFSREVGLVSLLSDFQAASFAVLGLIPATLLGYFVGMFTCWPFIRPICSRVNGAPFKVGDHVLILSGAEKRQTAEVYEITVGQGGWNLVRLEFGDERRKTFRDIFEEYSLFRINGEDAGPNSRPRSQLSKPPDVQTPCSPRMSPSSGCG